MSATTASTATPAVTSTALVGLIYPPNEVREIIDKTAKMVAKLGAEFESKVMREANSPKFSFLLQTDMYHQYYQHKIGEFKGGDKVPEPTPEQMAESLAKREPAYEASEEVRRGLLGQVAPLVEQRELERRRGNRPKENPAVEAFYINVPPDLPELDLNVMKLAALYTARNGPSFETGLSNRESRNIMFAFLRPQHSLHGVYLRLVESYAHVGLPPGNNVDTLDKLADESVQLKLALDRWAYESEKEQAKLEAEAADDKERQLNAMIDWNEFINVGEINFAGDDVTQLPPLVTVVQLRALARMQATEAAAAGVPPVAGAGVLTAALAATVAGTSGNKDMDMDMDMETDGGAASTTVAGTAGADDDDADDTLPAASAHIDATMIRTSFKRDEGKSLSKAARVQICPRCGQEIPIDEMAEHMRIELLNPKYLEQRRINVAKTTERAFAGSAEITANLARFAQKRSDIFGDDGAASGSVPVVTHTSLTAAAAAKPEGAQMSALDLQLEAIKRQTQLPDSSAPSNAANSSTSLGQLQAQQLQQREAQARAATAHLQQIQILQQQHMQQQQQQHMQQQQQQQHMQQQQQQMMQQQQRAPVPNATPVAIAAAAAAAVAAAAQMAHQAKSGVPAAAVAGATPTPGASGATPSAGAGGAGMFVHPSRMHMVPEQAGGGAPTPAAAVVSQTPIVLPQIVAPPVVRPPPLLNLPSMMGMPPGMMGMPPMMPPFGMPGMPGMPPQQQQQQPPPQPLPQAAQQQAPQQQQQQGRARDEDGDDDGESGEPGAKRARFDADEWAVRVPKVRLLVRVPDDAGKRQWQFNGQEIELEVDSNTTILGVKALLSAKLGDLAPNKQKLASERCGMLKDDAATLAKYNFNELEHVSVSMKSRGGKK